MMKIKLIQDKKVNLIFNNILMDINVKHKPKNFQKHQNLNNNKAIQFNNSHLIKFMK
jgi:hypothetical protein